MRTIGIATGTLAVLWAGAAFAQGANPPAPGTAAPAETADYMRQTVPAPRGAFELGVDAGYTQGFGSISRGRGVGDVAGAGGTLGISAGYRINPRLSIGARGELEAFAPSSVLATGTSVRGGAAELNATYHIMPYNRLDPWVTLGTGYRALRESPQGTQPSTTTHGLELGRVEVGLDLRPSQSVAISPVIGADLSMFMWRTGGGAETAALVNKTLNTFVFAGVKGRFDLGGSREAAPPPEATTARRER